MARERHIVAIGGGGFLADPLGDFVLGLTGRERPKLLWVPTASADDPWHIVRFYDEFKERAQPAHLLLFDRTVSDLRSFVLEHDVICVTGGNTANMLAVWRVHGLDAILREAWVAGIVLCGWSAGAICWFEAGVTDSFGPRLSALNDGLGFLPGSFCPHFDAEPKRRPTYHRLVAEGLLPGIAADDRVGVHFAGRHLVEAVTGRPDAQAYRVEHNGEGVVEAALPTRLLS